MKESTVPLAASSPTAMAFSQATDTRKSEITNQKGASFDATTALSGLKRLQDASMFEKARFRFRLYRK